MKNVNRKRFRSIEKTSHTRKKTQQLQNKRFQIYFCRILNPQVVNICSILHIKHFFHNAIRCFLSLPLHNHTLFSPFFFLLPLETNYHESSSLVNFTLVIIVVQMSHFADNFSPFILS